MSQVWKFEAEDAHRPADLPLGVIYLAAPYTHDDVYTREERFLLSCRACAFAMNVWGVNITSAIVFTHPLLTRYPMPVEWEFWAKYDETIIDTSDEVWVLCIPGYTNSVGTNAEIKLAKAKGKRLRYMVPKDRPDLALCGYELLNECPKEEELYGKVAHGRLAVEKL
jgi:hypothetical protein